MPSRSEVAVVLSDLALLFERLGARWYLFGAQAVVLHGRPRLTEDVDVTVELERSRTPELVRAAAEAGFALRIEDDVEAFVEQAWVLPLRHGPTGVDVDLVLAGSGLEMIFLDRAGSTRVGDVLITVIAAGDLVVSKILAGRPKDIDDAAGVLALSGERIDLDRVRALLRQLEEVLSVSDLVSVLDCLLAQQPSSG